jgi:hypothetical protein
LNWKVSLFFVMLSLIDSYTKKSITM